MCKPAVGCPAPHQTHGQGGGTMLLVAVTCAALLLAPHLTLPHLPGRPDTRPQPATTRDRHPGHALPSATAAVAARAAGFALAQLGKPYQWGQQGPASFDCSGLAWAAYRHAGLTWPRMSADGQYRAGPRVKGALHSGDLLFYHTDRVGPRKAGHVGVYLGHAQMIEAPYSGARVRVGSIKRDGYLGATRPGVR